MNEVVVKGLDEQAEVINYHITKQNKLQDDVSEPCETNGHQEYKGNFRSPHQQHLTDHNYCRRIIGSAIENNQTSSLTNNRFHIVGKF